MSVTFVIPVKTLAQKTSARIAVPSKANQQEGTPTPPPERPDVFIGVGPFPI